MGDTTGYSYPPGAAGEGGGEGGGAPTDAQYLVGAADGDLSAERVVTDTATIEWDLGTANQAKAWVVAGSIGSTELAEIATDRVLGRATAGTGVVELLTCTAAGRALLAAASAAAQRIALALGALATKDTVATGDIDNDAVTFGKFQNIATARLLGRSSASTGDVEAITIGDGLTLAGGELSATAGGEPGTFTGGSCEVAVDFGHASGGEETFVAVTVTGQGWVTPTTRIVASVAGATDDHDPEDAAIEGLVCSVGNVVDGVGFDLFVAAPNGTWGEYLVHCVGV